jgi:hypothetical protein
MQINLGKGGWCAQGLGWGAQGLGQAAAQGGSHAASCLMPRQDSPQSSSHPQGSTKTYPRTHTPNPTQTTDTGGGKGGSHHTHPLQGQTYASPPSNSNHQDSRPPPRQHQPPHKPYYAEGRFRMGDDSENRRQRKQTHTLHTARALQAHSYSDDETVNEEEPPSPRRAEGEALLVPITCILDTGAGPISFAQPSLIHNIREAPTEGVRCIWHCTEGEPARRSPAHPPGRTARRHRRVCCRLGLTSTHQCSPGSVCRLDSASQRTPAVPQDRE